jgi:methionine synthase I (cobalamin-dependent)
VTDPRRFAAALARGPILLDAGMGTRLIGMGLDPSRADSASWTLRYPDLVFSVHRVDARAGADAVLTNTFTAHVGRSARDMDVLCRDAVALAREAVGPSKLVLGSLGPRDDDSYATQARALADAGADALILETHDAARALLALPTVREVAALPVLVSVYRWDDADSASGRAGRLLEAGAAALGVNCTNGPDEAIALLERVGSEPGVPLLAKPNAGPPGWPAIRPGRLAAAVPRLLAMGVRLIGGCCGTTEAHLAALRRALDRAARDSAPSPWERGEEGRCFEDDGPFNPPGDCGSIERNDDPRG